MQKASNLKSLSDVLMLIVTFCKQSRALAFSEMGTWNSRTTKIRLLNSPLHLLLVQEENIQPQLFPLCPCDEKTRQLPSLCFLNQLRACPQLSCKSDCVWTPTRYSLAASESRLSMTGKDPSHLSHYCSISEEESRS